MSDFIYLGGAINTRSLDEQNKQAQLYAEKQWELKGGPATHRVKVSIPADRVDAFCDWLRDQPVDEKVERFTSAAGKEIERRNVSFFLDGREMSETWVKLSKALNVASDSGAPF